MQNLTHSRKNELHTCTREACLQPKTDIGIWAKAKNFSHLLINQLINFLHIFLPGMCVRKGYSCLLALSVIFL